MRGMAPPFTSSGQLSARALRSAAAAASARSRFHSPGGLTHGDLRASRGPWGQQVKSDTPHSFQARITETGQGVTFTLAADFGPTDAYLVIEDELPSDLVPPFDLRPEGGGEVLTVTECRPRDADTSDLDDASNGFEPPSEEEEESPGDVSPGESEPPITGATGTVCVARRWLLPHLSDSATEALLNGQAVGAEPKTTYPAGSTWEVPGTVPYGFVELRQDFAGTSTTHTEGRAGSITWELDASGNRVSPLNQIGAVNPVYEVNGEPLTPGDVVRCWLADGDTHYQCERLHLAPVWLRVGALAPTHFGRRKLVVDAETEEVLSVETDWKIGRPRASNRTTLTQDVAEDATLIEVDASAANFGTLPLATQFFIGINNEVMRVVRRQAPNVWEVVRRQWGSTPDIPVTAYTFDGKGNVESTTRTTWTHREGDQVALFDGQDIGAADVVRPIAPGNFGVRPAAPTVDQNPPLFDYAGVGIFEANQQQVYNAVGYLGVPPAWPLASQAGQPLVMHRPEPLTCHNQLASTGLGAWTIRVDVRSGVTFQGFAPGTAILRTLPAAYDQAGVVTLSAQSFRGKKWVDRMVFAADGSPGNTAIEFDGFSGVRIAAYDPETDTTGDPDDFAAGSVEADNMDVAGTLTAGTFVGEYDDGSWA